MDGIGRDRVARMTHREVGVERLEFHDPHIANDHARPGYGVGYGPGGHDHGY